MPVDADLAARLRAVLSAEPQLSEQRMFGGVAFLLDGRLAVSASSQGGLLVRVDPAETDALIDEPTVTRFVMRGRAMDGWLHVLAPVVEQDADLLSWAARGVAFARTLPRREHSRP